MKQLKPLAAAIGGLVLMGGSAMAYAIPTEIQLSTTGSGTGLDGSYDVTNINEIDWQSSGDLNIQANITVNGAATTLAAYFGGGLAALGDNVVFNINAQGRMNDLLAPLGGSISVPTLDSNGLEGGDTGFEVTYVLNATENATVINTAGGAVVLLFTGISGSTTWLYDATPDSVVDTGAGFGDGVPILTASLVGTGGTFTAGVGGSSLLTMAVTGYNTAYIQTDPDANAPLIGATYDTLVSLVSAGEASASTAGETVAGHVVGAGDQTFKADANSEFEGVPEPGTLFLLGAGLLGLGGFAARRKAA